MGAGAEVIAINPPLLTTHSFPPIELDYDIIRPRRIITHNRIQAKLNDIVVGYS